MRRKILQGLDTNKINFIFQAKNVLVNNIIKYHFIKISIHTDDEKCNGPIYKKVNLRILPDKSKKTN